MPVMDSNCHPKPCIYFILLKHFFFEYSDNDFLLCHVSQHNSRGKMLMLHFELLSGRRRFNSTEEKGPIAFFHTVFWRTIELFIMSETQIRFLLRHLLL